MKCQIHTRSFFSFLFVLLMTVPAWAGGVISVNIADGTSGLVPDQGLFGLAPAAGGTWVNVVENPSEKSFSVVVPYEYRDEAAQTLENVSLTFETTRGFGRYKPDGVTIDADAPYLKRYLDDGSTSITVTARNLPYKASTLYVYLQADYGASVGKWEGGDFQPISVNGTWYGYSEEAGATIACAQNDYWGAYGTGRPVVGVNTLAIPVQYGREITFTIPARHRRSCLAAFQIVESDEPVDIVPGAISVNFGSAHKAVAEGGALGALAGELLMADSWNNVAEGTGEEHALKVWDGETMTTIGADDANAPRLTWSGSGTWYNKSAGDAFLYGYLDDNESPTACVSGIPWKTYDVIVYLAADWNNGEWAGDFNAVKVNGSYYAWSSVEGKAVPVDSVKNYWGTFGAARAAYGVNAVRISGVSGETCTIETGNRQHRGGFAAFQIVRSDAAEIVAEGDIDTREINRLAAGHRIVSLTIPAGSTITLAHNAALTCEKLIVVSDGNVRLATWNAIAPADETDVGKIESEITGGRLYKGWEPTKRVISLNFNSEKGEMTGEVADGSFAGVVPASSWNNISGSALSGEIVPTIWNGTTLANEREEAIIVSWTQAGAYGWGSSPNPFMRGWLNASGAGHWTLKATGIPFVRYDVVLYYNWDGKGSFHPQKMNGAFWTWNAELGKAVPGTWADKWGASSHSAAAELGVNALRIVDQTSDSLDFYGEGYNNIAAIQIIEYCPPVKEKRPGFSMSVR